MKPEFIFGNFEDISINPRRGVAKGYEVDGEAPMDAKAGFARPLEGSFWKLVVGAQILLVIIIIVRLAVLQVWRGSELRAVADGNRIMTVVIPARRGIINDRTGAQIVQNVPVMSAWFTPSAHYSGEAITRAEIVARLIHLLPSLPPEAQERLLEDDSGIPVLVIDDLTHAQAIGILAHQDLLPGIEVRHDERRALTGVPEAWSHIIGYVGRVSQEELGKTGQGGEYGSHDYIGKTAFEKKYEERLRGQAGIKRIETDAVGEQRAVISEDKLTPGQDLQIAIWKPLQEFLYERISNAVRRGRASGGTASIINPHTGEVYALVSFPGFDPEVFSSGDSVEVNKILSDPRHALFNRSISGLYPTGSTLKPVIAAAALKEGIIKPDTRILSTGGLRIGSWFFPDWKIAGHGWVDMSDAIAESVNTFFYTIGGGYEDVKGLGVERIVRYARSFGLGNATGIDLLGEAEGFLPTPDWKERVKGEPWYVGDTYHLAIGQGDVLATPLQVAVFTSVFANNGKVVQPHLLLNDGGVQILRDLVADGIVSNEILQEVRKGLRQTVASGSARSLAELPITSAGKTGTAEVGGDKPPHAWFTGYSPAENPEIVVTILIENGGEGSAAAVPVAKEVFEWWWQKRRGLESAVPEAPGNNEAEK